MLVTVLALAWLFRRSLVGRYPPLAAEPVRSRPLLVVGLAVCAGLGPALLLGVNVLLTSAVGAAVLVVGCVVGARDLLRWRLLPWPLVLGVSVLFVLVGLAHDHGLGTLLGQVAGHGESWSALLRLAGLGALGANVPDNLPSYLARSRSRSVRRSGWSRC